MTDSAFGGYGDLDEVEQHWAAAFFTSTVVYIAIGAAVVLVGTATRQIIAKPKPVEVKFVEKVLKEPPPPPPVVQEPKPPPPVPQVKPMPRKSAPAAAAVVPKNMKVRKLDAPPPAKKLEVPTEMSKEPPKEVDASLDKGIAVYGEPGTGDPAGLEGGIGSGLGDTVGDLPPGSTPPKPFRSNRHPRYPMAALAKRATAVVVLQLTIRADGKVENIKVVEGEEPFASEAVKSVSSWRYEPAIHEGQRISVSHTVKVRFKLRA